jgi:hypothetical protein
MRSDNTRDGADRRHRVALATERPLDPDFGPALNGDAEADEERRPGRADIVLERALIGGGALLILGSLVTFALMN